MVERKEREECSLKVVAENPGYGRTARRIEGELLQKLLGIGLIALSIVGCMVFSEDASGFVFTGVLGTLRFFCNFDDYE